jgi:hypothetical protein
MARGRAPREAVEAAAPDAPAAPARRQRLLAITCEVLARSVYLCAARSPHVVDVHLLQRGLHDQPPNLRAVLQAEIDSAGPPHDAVVLAYGLCGGATAGLRAGGIPLVVPRAHDCITLFLGDRERYADQFASHPGTFWYVQDYLEREESAGAFAGVGAISDAAARETYEAYVARYGKDNADYLMEALGEWQSHYTRAAFVDMGLGDAGTAEMQARDQATRRGWSYERLAGELALVRGLVDGAWDEADFLIVRPGERLVMAYDERVIRAEPVGDA